jgi:hypothetical protein
MAASLHLVVARNERQIADAERLRWIVYGEEERLLGASDRTDERESDGYDFSDATTHLLVYAGREPVGTVRLTLARPLSSVSSRPLGLPLESNCVLIGFDQPRMVVAEVTRFCVLRRFRGTRVTAALFGALRIESERRGVTHWVAVANMETDSSEDAAIAYQLIQARNLLSGGLRAQPRGRALPPGAGQRRLYTDEQRLNAARGELGALKLPHVLALFAGKMGARYLGPPYFDTRFNVFAAQLATDLAELGDKPAAARALSGLLTEPRLPAELTPKVA